MKTDLLADLCGSLDYGRSIGLLLENFQAEQKALAALIQSAPKEQAIQTFLETHPVLLLHAMLDGFYNVASKRSALFAKVQLGSEFETDFAYCSGNSMGVWWTLVELERADVPLFNKSGDPSKYLTHALRQVQDWQAWISDHQEYAMKQLTGLVHDHPVISGWINSFRRPCSGLIVIGRRSSLTPDSNRLRAQMCVQNPSIEIITYDRLFDDYFVDKSECIDAGKDQVRTIQEIQD